MIDITRRTFTPSGIGALALRGKRWRVAAIHLYPLEARGLGSISINVRITAVHKMAVEAADSGFAGA